MQQLHLPINEMAIRSTGMYVKVVEMGSKQKKGVALELAKELVMLSQVYGWENLVINQGLEEWEPFTLGRRLLRSYQ
jgi:hypothetical protein